LPTSGIVWQGASQIDGSPIVAIATGIVDPSQNSKTGPMIQIWILRADMSPLEAIARGLDRGICGDCPHTAPAKVAFGQVEYRYQDRACYVDVGKAPMQIWSTFAAGGYRQFSELELRQLATLRSVRFGAYGDPYAVPYAVWRPLVESARLHTGYTHQWQRADASDYRGFLMASVDNLVERELAIARGWRTFRIRDQADPLEAAEVNCPASAEAGHKTQCFRCNLCAGADKVAKSVAIVVHGQGSRNFVPLSGIQYRRDYV
jgi:hypothetical protein